MKRFGFKLIGRKPVQVSVNASLAGSTALPTTSGFAWLDNSQGASATLAEFTDALSSVVAAVDLSDDNPKDGPFKAEFNRLQEASGEYENSSSDHCSGMTNWDCPRGLAVATAVAFNCAAAVYQKGPKASVVHDADPVSSGLRSHHRQPRTEGVEFKEIQYGSESILGTTKAIGVWWADSTLPCEELPAVIIACRGTEKTIDSVVNANGRPRLLAGFLATNPPAALEAGMKDLTVHGGFLNSAMRLSALVARQLSRTNKEAPSIKIIFTGHSAGGAVASLLFLKSLLEAPTMYPNLKLSCITFGSPPTLSGDVTALLAGAPELERNRGHMLAFVNESDVVPRADQAYTRSLIDLYRVKHGLGPLMESSIVCDAPDHTQAGGGIPYVLPPLYFQQEDGAKQDDKASAKRRWRLPLPDYHILGELVHLRKVCVESAVDGQEHRVLVAQTIPQAEFQKLLYCGTRSHSRSYYHDRVDMILRGTFNSRESW